MARERVSISSLIAPVYYKACDDIQRMNHSEYWFSGGRGSLKSSFISIMIVLGLISDRDANAIVYRKVADTLRESVYAQIAWAIDMLGYTSAFQFRLSPLEITCKITGQRILFRGADDPGKSKSLKLKKGYFKYLWFEELTEFNNMEAIYTIKASVIRGSGKAATFYSYNPPISASNWTNEEALRVVPDRLVHKSNYTQAPPEWLGRAFITDAETMRDTNERAYRHMYLGEITGTGGQVFDNLEIRDIPEDESKSFASLLFGLDFGFSNDPLCVLKMNYSRQKRTLYILDEIYGTHMTLEMVVPRLKEFAGRNYITCDSEDPYRIDELKSRGIQAIPAKKGPGSVEFGVSWLQGLAKIIINKKKCPNTAREFTLYEYDQDKNGNFLARCKKENDHAVDACRYGMEIVSMERRAITVDKNKYGLY